MDYSNSTKKVYSNIDDYNPTKMHNIDYIE